MAFLLSVLNPAQRRSRDIMSRALLAMPIDVDSLLMARFWALEVNSTDMTAMVTIARIPMVINSSIIVKPLARSLGSGAAVEAVELIMV